MYKVVNYLKKEKNLLVFLSLIVAGYVIYFKFYLNRPFLLSNDQWFQYNVFYKEWLRLVIGFFKGEALPMYSQNMYLGTDFYSAMGYYCTGDIFLPILLIFHNNVELGLIIETIICFYLSAVFMSKCLEIYDIKDAKIRIFISLIYALGGYANQFLGNYMFYRFYAFLPLLFYGLRHYFINKYIYIIASAVLFLQSYYLMFPTLIFLFLFSLFYEYKRQISFKILIKDFFILLGALLLGFMISAIITLPSMMYLLENNPRIGQGSNQDIFWNLNIYKGMLTALTSYVPWTINTIFKTNNNHYEHYSLFITIVPLVASLSYIFTKKNKAERYLFYILLAILCLKPLTGMMHGFSRPSLRWAFLFTFYLELMAAKGLENSYPKKENFIFLIYIMLYLIIILTLYIKGINYVEATAVHFTIIIVCFILNIIIYIIFRRFKNIALWLCIFELFSLQAFDFYIATNGAFDAKDAIDREVVQYYKDLNSGTYRFYHNYKNNLPPSVLNQNKALDYGFMGVTSYNSMYDYTTKDFSYLSHSQASDDLNNISWLLECDNPYANTMLGVKYYIVYKEEDLPPELTFDYVYNLDYLSVYENKNFQGFGYSAKAIKYLKDFDNTKDFIDYILIDDSNFDLNKYKNINYQPLNIKIFSHNYLEASIELDSPNIVLIPIPNNSGWRIKADGQEIQPISVNGGFIGLCLNAGKHEIKMNFISPYFKSGAILSFIGILITTVIFYKNKNN